jgi:hypothetical protein
MREYLSTAVLFDLDSCLADTRHRWGLSPMADPESTWERYCAARAGDQPIAGSVTAARLHYLHNQVHVVSGSEASSRDVTLAWLARHRVPFDVLRQRAPGDTRENAEVKIAYILELRASGIEPVLFYEDHPDVTAAIEAGTGVPVVCVNPRYPADREKFRTAALDGLGGGL